MRDRMNAVTVSFSLTAMALILLLLPFSPGCLCIEDTALGPVDSISRGYEGYIVREDNGQTLLFSLNGLWERAGGVGGIMSLPGDTTEVYNLEDIHLGGGVLRFTVTISSITDVPLDFEASVNMRSLSGTFERTGGARVGSFIGVSVEGVTGQDRNLIGAYELMTTYTFGDTLGDVYSDSLSVRLEFEPEGTFRAVSRTLPDGEEVVELGDYAVVDRYLFITLEGGTGSLQLPISMRGFVVSKDLMLLASPGPFPSFEVLVPVNDGVQVEHFKQVY